MRLAEVARLDQRRQFRPQPAIAGSRPGSGRRSVRRAIARPIANTAAMGYRKTPPCLKKLTTRSSERSWLGWLRGQRRDALCARQVAVICDLAPEFVTIEGRKDLFDEAVHRPVRPAWRLCRLPRHDIHHLRQLPVAGDGGRSRVAAGPRRASPWTAGVAAGCWTDGFAAAGAVWQPAAGPTASRRPGRGPRQMPGPVPTGLR